MANSLNQPLENKYVVLKPNLYRGSDVERVFLCKSGFGCFPSTGGTAIFGEFIFDGERCRIHGFDVLRLATEEEVSEAMTTP